jgi:hypothetical protein
LCDASIIAAALEFMNYDDIEKMMEGDNMVDFENFAKKVGLANKWLAEGNQRGRHEGLREGKVVGEKNTRYNIAYNMKKEGMAFPMIVQLTGLTLEQVKKLRKRYRNNDDDEDED